MRNDFLERGTCLFQNAEKAFDFRMAKLYQRSRCVRAYFWDALAGRAVALNGRQPPRKVKEGIMRIARLYDYRESLASQFTSHFANIGHAAAEAAALPAIAAHYILHAFSSATFGAEEGTGRSDVYLTRLSLRLISSIRSMGFTALAAVSRLTLISGHSYLRQLYSLAIVLSLM